MEILRYGLITAWEIAVGYSMFVWVFPERRSCHVISRVSETLCVLAVWGLYTWNSTMCFIGNGACVLVGITVGMCLTVYYKCEMRSAFCWGLFYYVFLSLARVPFLVFEGMYLDGNVSEVNLGAKSTGEFFYEIIILVTLTFVFKVYILSYEKQKKNIKQFLERYYLFELIISIIMWWCMSLTLESGMVEFQSVSWLYLFVGSAVMLCAVLVLLIYIWSQSIKMERELLEQRQIALRDRQLEGKKLFDSYERRLHDVKYKFLYIEQCLEEKKCEKALAQLREERDGLQKGKVWTGYQEIDFVLNSKRDEIEKLSIKIEFEVSLTQMPIESLDFSIVLGNLLDNAIEAAEGCEANRRYIYVCMKNMNRIFQMTIRNSANQMPKVRKGRFQTTKTETARHGWGLENVQMIVEKHGGEMEFRYDEKSFEIKIKMLGGE